MYHTLGPANGALISHVVHHPTFSGNGTFTTHSGKGTPMVCVA